MNLTATTSVLMMGLLVFNPAAHAQLNPDQINGRLVDFETKQIETDGTTSPPQTGTVGWQKEVYGIKFSGNIPTQVQRQKIYAAETVFTNAKDKAGDIAFTCINNKISLAIALEPRDFEAFIQDFTNSRRAKGRRVSLWVNGEQWKHSNWTYLPKLKILLPRKTSERNKIYNSVIRQDSIEIKMEMKDKFSLQLPPADKTFYEFGAACGVGVKAK